MPKRRPPTSDAIETLHRRFYEGKPERIAALEEARADDEVARKILQLRLSPWPSSPTRRSCPGLASAANTKPS